MEQPAGASEPILEPRIRSTATLRIMGDTIVPEAVTRLLGCKPTGAWRKGDVRYGKPTGREDVRRFGMWMLRAEDRESEDLNAQVAEILDRLNADSNVWASLARQYNIDLPCGLFMQRWNEDVSLSPKTLAALGSRGLKLWIDLYNAPDDEAEDKPTVAPVH
jgi:Domain of unknown function (DUF4279)